MTTSATPEDTEDARESMKKLYDEIDALWAFVDECVESVIPSTSCPMCSRAIGYLVPGCDLCTAVKDKVR